MSDDWQKEVRRLELEAMGPAELATTFQGRFGEGTAPVKADPKLTIQKILDDEFPQCVQPSIKSSAYCSTCKTNTPHKTSPIKGDTGAKNETLQCSICGTFVRVLTGEHGESFQENLDAPESSDSSEL